MTPGTVCCDNNFQFLDGSSGKKIIISLSKVDQNSYLFVKTTSKEIYKGKISGCQLNDRYPNFFIPQKTSFLTLDTWVMLNEFYEIKLENLFKKRTVSEMQHIGQLEESTTIQLLKCAIGSKDIQGNHQKALSNTLHSFASDFVF